MACGRYLLAGFLLAVALGGGAQSSQPEIPAIGVIYFRTNSAKVEAPEQFSSTVALAAEQTKSFRAKIVFVVPDGALQATSTTRKRILDARVKVVVDALIAHGVSRETISVQLKFEDAQLYDGLLARSAKLNAINVLIVPDPAGYAPPFRPMMPEPTPLPAPSKLPEVHLDEH